uniref:Nucleic acid binding protein n=1 Tax=Arundo donax TaxID=35708 RepID=A0A0A9FFV9_ARUDO
MLDTRIISWLSSLVHMGSTCMKGPSFWCSASNSAKY